MRPANHISLSMSRKTGTEGPAYDPYEYEEIFIDFSRACQRRESPFVDDGFTIAGHLTLHQGLGEWVKIEIETRTREVNGFWFREEHITERQPLEPDSWDDFVEFHTGYTLTQIRRFYRKMEAAKLREHRGHGQAEWSPGFPGEELLFCPCGAVLDSTFNEAAII